MRPTEVIQVRRISVELEALERHFAAAEVLAQRAIEAIRDINLPQTWNYVTVAEYCFGEIRRLPKGVGHSSATLLYAAAMVAEALVPKIPGI